MTGGADAPMPKLAVVACAVLEPELKQFSAGMDHLVHVDVLEQGLHNEPDRLRDEVRAAVHRAEDMPAVEAVALLYGLCSRGTEGIASRRVPLVVPRAHDCITLLLGSKEHYAEYVAAHPGTYWYSPGWIATDTQPGRDRYDRLYAEYLEKYGEDNAEYLMEMEQGWMREYDRAAYVDLGVGDTEADLAYTRDCAEYLNWRFDHLKGQAGLLMDLLCGHWDAERFLVLQPGETLRMTSDARVIEKKVASGN